MQVPIRPILFATILASAALASAADWFDDALPGPFLELRAGGTLNLYGTGDNPLDNSRTRAYPWFGPRIGWGMKDYRSVVGLGAAAIPWTDSDENGGDAYILAFYRRFTPELARGLYLQAGLGSWLSDMSTGENLRGPGYGLAAGWEIPCAKCEDSRLFRHIGLEASLLQGWNRANASGQRSDAEPIFDRHGTTIGLSASLMWY